MRGSLGKQPPSRGVSRKRKQMPEDDDVYTEIEDHWEVEYSAPNPDCPHCEGKGTITEAVADLGARAFFMTLAAGQTHVTFRCKCITVAKETHYQRVVRYEYGEWAEVESESVGGGGS